MTKFHSLDFLVQLLNQLGFVGAIDQKLHTFFKKLVGNLLTFKSHHAVLAGDAGQLHHPFDHDILFLDWRKKSL